MIGFVRLKGVNQCQKKLSHSNDFELFDWFLI